MQSRLRHSSLGMQTTAIFNILDEMKAYTDTVDLDVGETTLTTTIPSGKSIYSVELISSTGQVITGELMGQPVIGTSGGYYTFTYQSVDAVTDALLRVIYK